MDQLLGRRQFLAGAASVAAVAALAACAPKAAEEEAASGGAPETEELLVWMYNPDGLGERFQEKFNELTDVDFKIKFELGDWDTNTKIMAALAAGDPPPVHYLGRWQLGDMAVRGAIIPLDDYVKASTTFKWENLWGRLQKDCTMWGKKWTVPMSTDTRAFFYNKTLLAEAGISGPPETLEELMEQAPKLTKRDDGGRLTQIGFTPSFANPPVYLMFCSVLWCKGGGIVDDDLKKITIASQQGVDAMQYLKELMDAQGGYNDAVAFTSAVTPAEGLDPFTMGAVATMMNGGWVFPVYDKVAESIDYDICAGPHFEGSDEPLNYDGGGSWMIFKQGTDQDRSWKFIERIMEDDFLTSLADEYSLLPATQSATKEWEKGDPRRPIFASTANTCRWIPIFSGTLETLGAMATMFDNVLITGNPIEDELKIAQDKMQQVLDRHNSFPPPV